MDFIEVRIVITPMSGHQPTTVTQMIFEQDAMWICQQYAEVNKAACSIYFNDILIAQC